MLSFSHTILKLLILYNCRAFINNCYIKCCRKLRVLLFISKLPRNEEWQQHSRQQVGPHLGTDPGPSQAGQRWTRLGGGFGVGRGSSQQQNRAQE